MEGRWREEPSVTSHQMERFLGPPLAYLVLFLAQSRGLLLPVARKTEPHAAGKKQRHSIRDTYLTCGTAKACTSSSSPVTAMMPYGPVIFQTDLTPGAGQQNLGNLGPKPVWIDANSPSFDSWRDRNRPFPDASKNI